MEVETDLVDPPDPVCPLREITELIHLEIDEDEAPLCGDVTVTNKELEALMD